MLNFKMNKNSKNDLAENEYPTRFKRFVNKSKGELNNLTDEQKVVSAITECLAIQGREDGKNYYINGERIVIDKVSSSPSGRLDNGNDASSYSASGSFGIGKIDGEILRLGRMSFSVSFRDSVDELGLDSLQILSADMNELPLSR